MCDGLPGCPCQNCVAGLPPKQTVTGKEQYGTWDDNYDAWKVGDIIAWEDARDHGRYPITKIVQNAPFVAMWIYWNDPKTGQENMTRETNLVRITDCN